MKEKRVGLATHKDDRFSLGSFPIRVADVAGPIPARDGIAISLSLTVADRELDGFPRTIAEPCASSWKLGWITNKSVAGTHSELTIGQYVCYVWYISCFSPRVYSVQERYPVTFFTILLFRFLIVRFRAVCIKFSKEEIDSNCGSTFPLSRLGWEDRKASGARHQFLSGCGYKVIGCSLQWDLSLASK